MCAILPMLEQHAETALLERVCELIPQSLADALKMRPEDFTRTRKLPFPRLITAVLSLVANGQPHGVDTHLGVFFRTARRSGMWPDAIPPTRSAISKARRKVPWSVFRDILDDAVALAYEVWPDDPQYSWNGLSVFAIDGSKYTLPASDDLRLEFDPDSGLDTPGKGHYPQCLVSTLYDVFRRLPVARTVVGVNGSERDEAEQLLPYLPSNSVVVFDRGYPSYDFFRYLGETDINFFLVRCPASCTFPAVEAFVASGLADAEIHLTPAKKARERTPRHLRAQLPILHLRAVRLTAPDGTVSVLLTNMHDQQRFSTADIVSIYFRRWGIEGYYRDEKITLDIERFHATTSNGIRQELFAVMSMSVISRILMMRAARQHRASQRHCQFTNAILTLSAEAALLTHCDPQGAVIVFREILRELARVVYSPPRTPRASQPRMNKHPPNTWSLRNRSATT